MLESESALGFLVDLDEEGSDEKMLRKAKSPSDVLEHWDPELAVYLRDGVECFYDTDEDGEFDLWLIDNDEDADADLVWVRKGQDWKIAESKNLRMFDVDHFKSNHKKLGKPFEKAARAILSGSCLKPFRSDIKI